MQFEERRKQLQAKYTEREDIAVNLRKAEDNIVKIEEHRQEAEELPALLSQHEQLSAQQHRLEGNIEGYVKSRQLSAGGQCPLLHEPCLNIKQKGIVSLESYFDRLLSQEHEQLGALNYQVLAVSDRISYINKYADWLSKLGQYIERRDNLVLRLQGVGFDIKRLEHEIEEIGNDLDELKHLDQLIVLAQSERDESEKADQQVRELDGLRKQMLHVQAQVQDYTIQLSECEERANELRGSGDELKGLKQQLNVLNDPYSQSMAQQAIMKQETAFQQQLQVEQQKVEEVEEQVRQFEQQLSRYAELDAHIGQQEVIQQQCGASYSTYLKNIDKYTIRHSRKQNRRSKL